MLALAFYLSLSASLCFPNFNAFPFSYFICMVNHIFMNYFCLQPEKGS